MCTSMYTIHKVFENNIGYIVNKLYGSEDISSIDKTSSSFQWDRSFVVAYKYESTLWTLKCLLTPKRLINKVNSIYDTRDCYCLPNYSWNCFIKPYFFLLINKVRLFCSAFLKNLFANCKSSNALQMGIDKYSKH